MVQPLCKNASFVPCTPDTTEWFIIIAWGWADVKKLKSMCPPHYIHDKLQDNCSCWGRASLARLSFSPSLQPMPLWLLSSLWTATTCPSSVSLKCDKAMLDLLQQGYSPIHAKWVRGVNLQVSRGWTLSLRVSFPVSIWQAHRGPAEKNQ